MTPFPADAELIYSRALIWNFSRLSPTSLIPVTSGAFVKRAANGARTTLVNIRRSTTSGAGMRPGPAKPSSYLAETRRRRHSLLATNGKRRALSMIDRAEWRAYVSMRCTKSGRLSPRSGLD